MHCPRRKVSKMAKTLWTRRMENRENIKSEFRRYKQKMTVQLNRKSALYCTLPLQSNLLYRTVYRSEFPVAHVATTDKELRFSIGKWMIFVHPVPLHSLLGEVLVIVFFFSSQMLKDFTGNVAWTLAKRSRARTYVTHPCRHRITLLCHKA